MRSDCFILRMSSPEMRFPPQIRGAPYPGYVPIESQEEIMFEHPDVMTSWVNIEIEDAPKRVLVIETELPLAPSEEDYDESRVSALVSAAQAFKADKGNGIDKVRLITTDFNDIEFDDEEEEEEE
jgi:hypothetical protein